MWLLKGDPKGPLDLREKSLYMAGLIIEMAGKAKKGKGRKIAEEILDSGKAYKKMTEIIRAQGENTPLEKIRVGRLQKDVFAKKSGKISHIDNKTISKIARIAGAPRSVGAGLYLYYHVGDRVKKGDKLYTIYSESKDKMKFALGITEKDTGITIR